MTPSGSLRHGRMVGALRTSNQEEVKLPCLFGCPAAVDKQAHYCMCPVLFAAQKFLWRPIADVSDDPLVRLGLRDPCIFPSKLLPVFFMRTIILNSLMHLVSIPVGTWTQPSKSLLQSNLCSYGRLRRSFGPKHWSSGALRVASTLHRLIPSLMAKVPLLPLLLLRLYRHLPTLHRRGCETL